MTEPSENSPETHFWKAVSWLLLLTSGAAAINPLTLAASIPLIGLGLTFLHKKTFGAWPRPDLQTLVLLALPMGLGFFSALWSITPGPSAERAIKIGGILIPAAFLLAIAGKRPEELRKNFFATAPIIFTGLGLGAWIELAFDFPLYRAFAGIPKDQAISTAIVNKFMAVLILPLPLLFGELTKARQWKRLVLLGGVSGLALFETQSQAAQLATLVMGGSWIGHRLWPRGAILGTAGVIGLAMVTIPWIAPPVYDHFAEEPKTKTRIVQDASFNERLEIYAFISRKIQGNPVTGYGMDCTRSITDFVSAKRFFPSATIMHPHNIGLQLWIEFGIFGIGAGLATLVGITRNILKRKEKDQQALFPALCGTIVFLMVSWSLWSSWLIALLVFLLVLALLVSPPQKPFAEEN